MKRLLSLLLMVTLLMSMVACNKNGASGSKKDTQTNGVEGDKEQT